MLGQAGGQRRDHPGAGTRAMPGKTALILIPASVHQVHKGSGPASQKEGSAADAPGPLEHVQTLQRRACMASSAWARSSEWRCPCLPSKQTNDSTLQWPMIGATSRATSRWQRGAFGSLGDGGKSRRYHEARYELPLELAAQLDVPPPRISCARTAEG
jgi:hypothetical protein